jgi:CRISPR-associated protein Cas5
MNNSDTNSNRISEKKEIDISILWGKPMLNSTVLLEIQPLAPLSMVSELPGSYYKTLKMPDKKMLCGLFENILGWHIALMDRKQIFEELKKVRKKQTAKTFVDSTKGSTYFPLLMEYFEIQECVPKFKRVVFYDDLWSRAFRRSDSSRHTAGVRYMDADFILRWRKFKEMVENDVRRTSREKNTLMDKLFKRYISKFPMYYSTPTKREFVQFDGYFRMKLSMDSCLIQLLDKQLNSDNIGYLGSSEGWINLTIKEII